MRVTPLNKPIGTGGDCADLVSPSVKALALVAGSLFWVYALAALLTKGLDAGPSVLIGLIVLLGLFALPILGFLSVRGHPRSLSYKMILFPAFIFSLVPPIILGCILYVMFVVPTSGHIYTRNTSKVSVGMSVVQVYQRIGLPEQMVADGHVGTIRYILDRPFHNDRLFDVTFVDGKVASCEIKAQ